MRIGLEKFGSVSAVLAAAACPVCFPKLAAIGALVGLGVLAPFEAYFIWVAQALVVLAFAGQVVAFRRNRNAMLLGAAVLSTLAFFAALYVVPSEMLAYVGLAGVVISGLWQLKRSASPSGGPISGTQTPGP